MTKCGTAPKKLLDGAGKGEVLEGDAAIHALMGGL